MLFVALRGVDVVRNHEHRFITTHPIIYEGQDILNYERAYRESINFAYYFEGIQPHNEVKKYKRSQIGNDVWLGQNVAVLQGVDIGNGVIAGANSVITRNVPDYAIVVGAPARIIKYRYSPEEIQELNKIKWWDWTDDEIRERFDDFYLPIDEFINKYKSNHKD